jgi:Protein of unknown function (DUF4241)
MTGEENSMTEADAQLDAEYGESWDPQRRALVGLLPAGEAARRHSADEPFAVLLGRHGRPRVLLEVDGRKDEIVAWCFDEQLRRAFLFEFGTFVPGRMALLRMAEWQYADGDRPEFDPASPRCLTTFGEGGAPVVQALDAPEAAFRTLEACDRWVDVPRFGTWAPLVAFLFDAPPERKRHRIVPHSPHRGRVRSSGVPPVAGRSGPLQPGPEMVTAFGPRARFSLAPDEDGDAPEVVVETRAAGMLRMPTGRLVAADPGVLRDGMEAFTDVLPRGRHPVTLAVARFVEQPGHVRVAGCRVDVREAPAVSWEQALRPGEDPSTLGDGQFFANGVDAGMLCFFDAAASPGFGELTEDWDLPKGLWHELCEAVGPAGSGELEDPETETNLIAFSIGWGDGAYPVWIGRAADGEVVCVVADGQVLCDSTYLGPA